MLNILEGFDLAKMGFNSADYLHAHIEAKKLAFADAAKYYADPDFVKVPMEGLASKAYATERRAQLDLEHAAKTDAAGDPTPYCQDRGSSQRFLETLESKYGGDTTYL